MTSTASKKAGAALAGLLVGGAVGFVLTETIAVFFHFVLDTTLDVEGNGALLALFAGVPLLGAVIGAVVGVRVAGRDGTGR
ncbi:hypothetical protein [Actinomadura algeriensis]|uniref:Major facilitator superfamily (MFS) profile domain-containing protein n=1 Tax=Actinomadura algeriensis TaxID=1679523 RepID=A0ABR9JZU2_9ACTN|nr:hypothetical protein [Actinomadura algeriensis]MBE1536093.1 hypothetical protein [Actinomadura algeriensis]